MDEAAAPVEAAPETPAPAETAPAEKAPPKPRTIDDDLEDVLKKHGGLKYKAGGKEKSITAAKDLTRYLSRVDGTETAATEALRVKSEAEGIKSRVAALAKMRPNERLKALADIGIDPKTLREAVEEEILADDERTKAQSHLTQRERELQAQLEERDAKLAEHDKARKDWEAKQEEEAQVAQSSQLYEKITAIAAKALQKAKIAGAHAPKFLGAIAEEIDRNERLGLQYDESDLAETVLKQHAGMARDYYSGLDVAALADEFEGMEVDDPASPGKKTTRAKLLMGEYARRLRARQGNGMSAPVTTHVAAPKPRTVTELDKIDAARTFGGGAW